MKTLFIDGKRTGYTPEQCGETMTVRQFMTALEKALEWGDLSENSPIYLANDHGYTFGQIRSYSSFSIGEDYETAEDYMMEEDE